VKEAVPNTSFPLFLCERFLPRRPHTGPVCRRTHSRRVTDKATPPHRLWGGAGT
jgi:hypothetical protein